LPAMMLASGPAASEGAGKLAAAIGERVTPSGMMARAGRGFQEVMGAAKNVPVSLKGAGDAALEIETQARSGGSMPKVIRDFLRRATDPQQGEMTYEEARRFYSNASRLSADEMGRLTPNMRRLVGQFTKNLGTGIEDAAGKAGKLPEYTEAMQGYRRGAQLKGAIQSAKKIALPLAGGAALGTLGYHLGKAVTQP